MVLHNLFDFDLIYSEGKTFHWKLFNQLCQIPGTNNAEDLSERSEGIDVFCVYVWKMGI